MKRSAQGFFAAVVLLLSATVLMRNAPAAMAVSDVPRVAVAAVDSYGEYTALTPARVFDTRDGTGQFGVAAALTGGISHDVQITGQGGVPATNASSVVLNVTVTATTAAGFLTVYPGNQAVPLASSLNFVPGQTVPNLVMVAMSSEGDVEFYNSAGNTHVVVDCFGAFTNERALPVPMAASALTPPQG